MPSPNRGNIGVSNPFLFPKRIKEKTFSADNRGRSNYSDIGNIFVSSGINLRMGKVLGTSSDPFGFPPLMRSLFGCNECLSILLFHYLPLANIYSSSVILIIYGLIVKKDEVLNKYIFNP